MNAGTPASFAALATRVLPSTFTIHCLFRSREGWMIQASRTTASAPRRCGTRSSVTTSAVAHSTFGTVSPGGRRASPRTYSTLSSFSSDRSTLVPMLPVAPTTTTLMLALYPRGSGAKRDAVPSVPVRIEEEDLMQVLVTGARGKVGRATVAALIAAGHDVRATDILPPVFERPEQGEPDYFQADLTDAGDAYSVVRGAEAVVHAAAIPEPTHNPPHVVFQNNLMSVFNVLEAAIRFGVPRFVNISSETVPGFFFAERPFLPDYVQVDEEHPIRPQDPYATAKHFSELLMDGAVSRSDIRPISIRPCWVQHEGNYERNLGPLVRELPEELSPNFLSYIDVYDLADAIALAVQSDLPGHEVFYIASPDNVGNRPLEELVRKYYGDEIEVRKPLPREDASYISIEKARQMLGYDPKRSWSDYLDDEGRLKPGVKGLFS